LATWLPKGRSQRVRSATPFTPAKATGPAEPAGPVASTPTRAGRDPEIIDLSILSGFVAGDPKMVRHFASRFVDAIPATLVELDSTLAAADVGALSALGHRLKSSSKVVGALGLAALCQSLEDLKAGGTVREREALVARLRAKLGEVSADVAEALA